MDPYDVYCDASGCYYGGVLDAVENPPPTWGAPAVCVAPGCGPYAAGWGAPPRYFGPPVPDWGQCGQFGCGPVQQPLLPFRGPPVWSRWFGVRP